MPVCCWPGTRGASLSDTHVLLGRIDQVLGESADLVTALAVDRLFGGDCLADDDPAMLRWDAGMPDLMQLFSFRCMNRTAHGCEVEVVHPMWGIDRPFAGWVEGATFVPVMALGTLPPPEGEVWLPPDWAAQLGVDGACGYDGYMFTPEWAAGLCDGEGAR